VPWHFQNLFIEEQRGFYLTVTPSLPDFKKDSSYSAT
jgi:hypothetical protein